MNFASIQSEFASIQSGIVWMLGIALQFVDMQPRMGSPSALVSTNASACTADIHEGIDIHVLGDKEDNTVLPHGANGAASTKVRWATELLLNRWE